MEFLNKMYNKNKYIYVVFIINTHYVRWEFFDKNSKIIHLYKTLESKYNIKNCNLTINDKNIHFHFDKDKFIKKYFIYNTDISCDVRVATDYIIKL
tara:strand:+ start:544 stop:831 length:288 start_codon:yes stop_codon:yes gene_type:complete